MHSRTLFLCWTCYSVPSIHENVWYVDVQQIYTGFCYSVIHIWIEMSGVLLTGLMPSLVCACPIDSYDLFMVSFEVWSLTDKWFLLLLFVILLIIIVLFYAPHFARLSVLKDGFPHTSKYHKIHGKFNFHYAVRYQVSSSAPWKWANFENWHNMHLSNNNNNKYFILLYF